MRLFMLKLTDLCWYGYQWRDKMGADVGKIGLLKMSKHGTLERSKQCDIGNSTSTAGDISWDSARRICFVMKELLSFVKHKIEERSVVVIVFNKETAVWKAASMQTLSRDNTSTVKVTNSGCMAEQIKSDKVEDVATGGSKIGEFGKVGK